MSSTLSHGGKVMDPKVIVALDFDRLSALDALVDQLEPGSCRLKVGKELFTTVGPPVVERLNKKGFEVFLDLKFHDIPNTTAQAVRAAARMGVWMVNVHASGGRAMMSRCREVLAGESYQPLLIAVTVLTSLSAAEVREIGFPGSPDDVVSHLARLAQESGMDGVVCSARESERLRSERGDRFCLVTPGIRPAGAALDDQVRVVTPVDALRQGSHYLVIGRPITQSNEPAAVLAEINRHIQSAGFDSE